MSIVGCIFSSRRIVFSIAYNATVRSIHIPRRPLAATTASWPAVVRRHWHHRPFDIGSSSQRVVVVDVMADNARDDVDAAATARPSTSSPSSIVVNSDHGDCGGGKRQKKSSGWKKRRMTKKTRDDDDDDNGVGGGVEGRANNEKTYDRRKRWNHDESNGGGDGDGGGGMSSMPNAGSFAHDDMRKLFDVALTRGGAGAHSAGEEAVGGGGDVGVGGGGGSTTNREEGEVEGGDDAMGGDGGNVPKRKLAILVSFVGTEYSGFQINANCRTLQSVLELGLYEAGLISSYNFGYPTKYGWSNSARTDKGVHAAAQVCSFKGEMICYNHRVRRDNVDEGDVGGDGGTSSSSSSKGRSLSYGEQFDIMRKRVNECLPPDIRVLDIERVTRSFCARTNRDRVRYQYMVPSYMLLSREEVRSTLFPSSSGKGRVVGGVGGDDDDAADVDASIARSRRDLARYRVSSERMESLRAGLKIFEGTHNFHNYTRRLGSDDATVNRYIISFVPLDPVIVPSGSSSSSSVDDDGAMSDDHDTQWIPLQVVGQSFLLNQIRKMVSAAIDHARGAVDTETIANSLTGMCKMKVDVAPPNGLFLDRSYFELYNRHKVKNMPRHNKCDDGDERHNTLDWVEAGGGEEIPPAVRRIEEFKNERIIPHIVREEAREGNFMHYMYSHEIHFNEMYGNSSLGDENRKGDLHDA